MQPIQNQPLVLNGVDYGQYCDYFLEVAKTFGTASFLFDRRLFIERIKYLQNLLELNFQKYLIEYEVQFAAKSFISKEIVQILKNESDFNIDTCSLGESYIAIESGFSGEKLGLHGNNKSEEELEFAISHGFAKLFIDNFSEIEIINNIAKKHNKTVNVLLRIKTGVHAGGHEFIATAHEDQKFGISRGEVFRYCEAIKNASNLYFAGIHSHIGSQVWNIEPFLENLKIMLDVREDLFKVCKLVVKEIDLGGGFGVQYLESDPEINLSELFKQMSNIISNYSKKSQLEKFKISFEPGRWLIAPCMSTIYKIGQIKMVEYEAGKHRQYISIDGGMSDNIRPILYDAKYSCLIVKNGNNFVSLYKGMSEENGSNCQISRIVGKHCESGDILISDVYLPNDIEQGDLLIIPVTGAYGYSMSSNYNQLLKPAVITLNGSNKSCKTSENDFEIMIRRQELSELTF